MTDVGGLTYASQQARCAGCKNSRDMILTHTSGMQLVLAHAKSDNAYIILWGQPCLWVSPLAGELHVCCRTCCIQEGCT